ncbi:MAG TPA: hypothetical protein PKD70_01230 [Saprospiraceae bacterium]|nr:hypothetical protein [Saprospiraceae bacterium]HMP12469.1 hypothetical protein [Saprospiraceae bacterium]
MKNTQLLLFLLCLAAVRTSAQSYNTALGMRLGTDWGVTLQQRIANRTTLEVLLQSSLQREEVLLTVMGEQHLPVISRRFNIYYGGGLHKGWINETDRNDEPYANPFGVTFIGGIEMSLARLNISYDFKPAINITGGQHNFYTQTGISLRYIIDKREWKPFSGSKNNKKKNRRKSGGINWRFWENF